MSKIVSMDGADALQITSFAEKQWVVAAGGGGDHSVLRMWLLLGFPGFSGELSIREYMGNTSWTGGSVCF